MFIINPLLFRYVEFDFHKETKGMRFENISKLSKSLHDDLSKIQ
jgi:hypothetical protein